MRIFAVVKSPKMMYDSVRKEGDPVKSLVSLYEKDKSALLLASAQAGSPQEAADECGHFLEALFESATEPSDPVLLRRQANDLLAVVKSCSSLICAANTVEIRESAAPRKTKSTIKKLWPYLAGILCFILFVYLFLSQQTNAAFLALAAGMVSAAGVYVSGRSAGRSEYQAKGYVRIDERELDRQMKSYAQQRGRSAGRPRIQPSVS